MSTKDARVELLQGTLDFLVLRTLRPGPAHGHTIALSGNTVHIAGAMV